jgi:hypothetical protein
MTAANKSIDKEYFMFNMLTSNRISARRLWPPLALSGAMDADVGSSPYLSQLQRLLWTPVSVAEIFAGVRRSE